MLTPAGRVLLEQGRELLVNAQKIVESAHQVNSGWESSINIALDTVWDITKLYPIVTEFYQLNTGVQVNLSEEVMGGSLEAIVEHRADIGIGGPPPAMKMPGIKFEQIMQAKWQFVVAKGHPLTKHKLPLNEDDVKPYPTIVIKDSSKNSPILSHRVFAKQATLSVATMEHKILALVQGVGVGFLPVHRIQSHLISGELVTLTIDKNAPETPQYCSWRVNNKGRALRWFVKRIIESSSSPYQADKF